jgi:hypothetical protein
MPNSSLHVGINYLGSPSGPRLQGCVNDAKLLASVARNRWGFKPENVRTLIEHQATKKKILDGLRELLDAQRGDDFVFFSFSGHGSQLPDTSGEEQDRLDETIVPYDASPFIDDSQIRDDELWEVLRKARSGKNLLVVLDSCHSGTATRNRLDGGQSIYSQVSTARFMPPAQEVTTDFDAFLDPEILGRRTPKGARMRRKAAGAELNHVLITGCRDHQLSNDMPVGNSYFGALTYYLVNTGEKLRWKMSLREWVEATAMEVLKRYPDQSPQIEGPSESMFDRKLPVK